MRCGFGGPALGAAEFGQSGEGGDQFDAGEEAEVGVGDAIEVGGGGGAEGAAGFVQNGAETVCGGPEFLGSAIRVFGIGVFPVTFQGVLERWIEIGVFA